MEAGVKVRVKTDKTGNDRNILSSELDGYEYIHGEIDRVYERSYRICNIEESESGNLIQVIREESIVEMKCSRGHDILYNERMEEYFCPFCKKE